MKDYPYLGKILRDMPDEKVQAGLLKMIDDTYAKERKALLEEENLASLTYRCPHCGGECKIPLGELIQREERNDEE